MNDDLKRVKDDLETIKAAMSVDPQTSFAAAWKQVSLSVWCGMTGLILVGWGVIPHGLSNLWAHVLFAVVLGSILIFFQSPTKRDAVQSVASDRAHKQSWSGAWPVGGVLALLIVGFLVWGNKFGIPPHLVSGGIWLIAGSLCLVLAVVCRGCAFVGWAIPFIAYGYYQPLMTSRASLWLFGLAILIGGLSSAGLGALQLKATEKNHGTH